MIRWLSVVDMRQYIGQRQVKLNSDLMTREPVKLGPHHAPLTHLQFYRVVQSQLKGLELKSQSTIHSLSANGDQYFGMTMLDNDADYYAPVLAWKTAHNQRTGVKLYIGAGFFETDTLCMTREMALAMRQTNTFAQKLPLLMQDSFVSLLKLSKLQTSTFKSFKQTQISESTAEHAMIDMLRHGVINVKRIEQVISQWDFPDDPALRKRKTVWRLFCAVADSYKPVTSTDAISTLVERSPRLMDYCKDMVVGDL